MKQKVINYLEDNFIKYKDLGASVVFLLKINYDLTDKQLRELIKFCYKNKISANFEDNKIYLTKGFFC